MACIHRLRYPEGAPEVAISIFGSHQQRLEQAKNLGTGQCRARESTPSLSPDKRDLYFSSNRPGGFGGKDIWVSHRLPNGKWSIPENLGEAVNTSADESCPFMARR